MICFFLRQIVWLRLAWKDDRLRWDPDEYSNITEIRVKPSSIWVPDLTLYNPSDGKHQYSEEINNQVKARVYHNGIVTWVPLVLYSVTCPMALRYFPFDIQVCYRVVLD